MSVGAVAREDEPPASIPGRAAVGVGAVLLALSLLQGWDAGLRDLFSPSEIAFLRRSGAISAFDAEPSTPFQLLVPWGAALLAAALLMGGVAVRGRAGRAAQVVIAATALATVSLLLRQLVDGVGGVPGGSVLGNAGALFALAGVSVLREAAEDRPPRTAALVLGVVAAFLLTGMVHDTYDVVDVTGGEFRRDVGASSWPESWLVRGLGARTGVDLGLIALATGGLVAAGLVAVRRLSRAGALALAIAAALVLVALLVVAIGPNPGVGGVDRFPAAAAAVLALCATALAALRLTGPEPVGSVPEEPVAAPEPRPPLPPMPPDHVWARPVPAPEPPDELRTAPAPPPPDPPARGPEGVGF